ncbi:hypothetical protein PVA45_03365 [Entomospira entomophila]|uniref:Uncharacterized protein n=1 Tax=Entomospira entomophila TaxID=2719988 RepID=A0A968G9N2_9SPIO|nr:hypothetical protein [Entomospira entomophilus]NIZ40551.1 hypothetical protein [Entomospira entomophilus]WDI36109.1 hypothetical protein PVA45_03365 [Entomospira entomophilus]
MLKTIVMLIMMVMSMSVAYAESFEERRFRDDRGSWITERYIKIAEYELAYMNTDIEGDIYIGRSYLDGNLMQHWIMIHHEVEFSKQATISDAMINKVRLYLQTLTLNGVVLKSSKENTVLEITQKKRDIEEHIRITISENDFNMIMKGTPWQGSIISTQLPSPIILHMKNRSRVINAMNNVSNKMEIRLKY